MENNYIKFNTTLKDLFENKFFFSDKDAVREAIVEFFADNRKLIDEYKFNEVIDCLWDAKWPENESGSEIIDIVIMILVETFGDEFLENLDGELHEFMFSYTEHIDEIILPKQIHSIGERCFGNSTIKKITISNPDIINLWECPFDNCNGLKVYVHTKDSQKWLDKYSREIVDPTGYATATFIFDDGVEKELQV